MLFLFSTENSLERSYGAETDMDQYLFDHCSPSHVPQLASCLKGDLAKFSCMIIWYLLKSSIYYQCGK